MTDEEYISVGALILEQRNKYLSYSMEFFAIFHVPLKNFWDKIFGLDVVRFDGWLVEQHGDFTKDKGLSTKELIRREYGERAVTVVESLF